MRWPYAWIAWETICHWTVLVACGDVAGRGSSCKKEAGLVVPVSSDYVKSLCFFFFFRRCACWFCFLFHAIGHVLQICGAQSEAHIAACDKEEEAAAKRKQAQRILWIWLENQLQRWRHHHAYHALSLCLDLLSVLAYSALLTKQEEEAAARRKQVPWIGYETMFFFPVKYIE